MSKTFINHELLKNFPVAEFRSRRPFPWSNVREFLTPEGFNELRRDFPPLELFEKHQNIERAYGQRPHNRYYLAYETSIYHREDHPAGGVLNREQLPGAWQQFIEELETSEAYRDFIKQVLEVPAYSVRYAWHAGFTGSEVSPHVDAAEKFGTHIIYFNTSEDWDPQWGGGTVVLGNRRTNAMNPDFTEFETVTAAEMLDNCSFLFKNTPEAWHGAPALTCPPGKYRRLFNVIFEVPEVSPDRSPYLHQTLPASSPAKRLLERARGVLRS